MRIVLDACVIFPTVMREILLGCATGGLFEPIWSDRIIEEWLRAAEKLGPGSRVIAVAEAAVMQDRFPDASIHVTRTEDLWLPDKNDVHVLETAICGRASGILTVNTRDFPLRILQGYKIGRFHPDTFLLSLAHETDEVAIIVRQVQEKAEKLSGRPQPLRALLKRTGLPRLGKHLDQV